MGCTVRRMPFNSIASFSKLAASDCRQNRRREYTRKRFYAPGRYLHYL